MTGAWTPKQSSRCTNVKLCDRAPGAIAVALPAIWIVKAKENQNSYGNTIELNFLLKGLNLLLKSVGKQRLPLAIPCEDMNEFAYMNVIPKVSKLSILWHRNMGFVWLTSWTLLQEKYSDTEQRAGSHIWSCWLLWHYIRGDPACVPLSLKGLSEATNCKPHRICSMWMTCVNAMPVYGNAMESAESAEVWNRGACDFPWALCKWIGPHVVEMEALLH
jgi:hypothetical protein